jgi:hypothetical protein
MGTLLQIELTIVLNWNIYTSALALFDKEQLAFSQTLEGRFERCSIA